MSSDSSSPNMVPYPVFVIMNPFTGSMFLVNAPFDPDQGSMKEGPAPASEASINSLASVKVEQGGGELSSECAICLGEYEIGEEAKKMPCKHVFHEGCIGKWLRVNGSCPVCRYRLPMVKDREMNTKENDDRENREDDQGNNQEQGGSRSRSRSRNRGMMISFVNGEMVIRTD